MYESVCEDCLRCFFLYPHDDLLPFFTVLLFPRGVRSSARCAVGGGGEIKRGAGMDTVPVVPGEHCSAVSPVFSLFFATHLHHYSRTPYRIHPVPIIPPPARQFPVKRHGLGIHWQGRDAAHCRNSARVGESSQYLEQKGTDEHCLYCFVL